MPQFVVCQCQHCGGKLEFDPDELSAGNSRVECPHCRMETVLFVPAPVPVPQLGPKKAKLVPVDGEWGGKVEDGLDSIANAFMGVGLLGLFFGGIGFLEVVSGDISSPRANWFWPVFGGLMSFFSGVVLSRLFKALAEMIRLMKKQAGLPVEGYAVFECGSCGQEMEQEEDMCPNPKCGALLDM
jgi:Zn finger protein HypA/HybF involved in hydrogenase expression